MVSHGPGVGSITEYPLSPGYGYMGGFLGRDTFDYLLEISSDTYIPLLCIGLLWIRRIDHVSFVVEFKRISLTGFRSCTSRSRYRSISNQTTRISIIAVNTVRYHSDVLAISQG
ncbi:hypothetical protein Tco_0091562 [Tanacetum coccineum]